MTGLLVFSLIIAFFHIFSLRSLLKTSGNENITENIKQIEENFPAGEDKQQGFPISLFFPVAIIVILSLVEIGYFIFAVFVLRDIIITISASILTGYNIYALIKFFPKIKQFFKNPASFLKEKNDSFDNTLNLVMAIIEIIFCLYVIIKIFLRYNFI